MQHNDDKIILFKTIFGQVLKELRERNTTCSRTQFAREFDIDRGNLSKIENGKLSCSVITLWKISEALGIKFSEFAAMFEKELGEDFKLMDE